MLTQQTETVGPAEDLGDACRRAPVVTVPGAGHRGENRRQVQVTDTELAQVRQDPCDLGEGELRSQLDTVGGHGVDGYPGHASPSVAVWAACGGGQGTSGPVQGNATDI